MQKGISCRRGFNWEDAMSLFCDVTESKEKYESSKLSTVTLVEVKTNKLWGVWCFVTITVSHLKTKSIHFHSLKNRITLINNHNCFVDNLWFLQMPTGYNARCWLPLFRDMNQISDVKLSLWDLNGALMISLYDLQTKGKLTAHPVCWKLFCHFLDHFHTCEAVIWYSKATFVIIDQYLNDTLIHSGWTLIYPRSSSRKSGIWSYHKWIWFSIFWKNHGCGIKLFSFLDPPLSTIRSLLQYHLFPL